ncbi:uncharacterized protein LY89DRAFT_737424 [Mollisia scopiformis]|uniref:Uncharacterized protein n=1 Tax=Mollisia scopiformis TaxID=149040 RepID=A0A194WZS3_MOLSC|nr:uncharacterized protein LY89DRAFT_737424 [Mollisia scopiformis]KUJ13445.1 hypothetical protein LY89DRAFT_737424 [Mollisia scopiformis]
MDKLKMAARTPLCKISIDAVGHKRLPIALSICHESRELALTRYSPLLTSDASTTETVLRQFEQQSYGNVVLLGVRHMQIDFTRDTLMIFEPEVQISSIASYIHGERVERLVWSRITSSYIGPWDINWARFAVDFPDLKYLNLVFGTSSWAAGVSGPRVNEQMIPMDSNLEDLFHFYQDITKRPHSNVGRDLSTLFFEFSHVARNRRNFWNFVIGPSAPSPWYKLSFETSFWTTKRALDSLLSLTYPIRVNSVYQLPRHSHKTWRHLEFPRIVLFRREVCDMDDQLFSRYEGIQELFREI